MKNIVIISFLGTGDYLTNQFTYKDKKYEERLFLNVLMKANKPCKVLLVQTEAAMRKNNRLVQQYLDGIEVEDIEIDEYYTHEKLWLLHRKLDEKFRLLPTDKEIELIIDITHSFRYLPLMALASARYFETVYDNVNLIDIFCAEPSTYPNKAHIISVKPFLYLMDWSGAVRRFNRYGNLDEMSPLLHAIHADAYKRELHYKPKHLVPLANAFDSLSNYLQLVMSEQVNDQISQVLIQMEQASADFDNLVDAEPMKQLVDIINNKLAALLQKDNSSYAEMRAHLQVVLFYLDNKMLQPAITLLRELLITAIFLKPGYDKLNNLFSNFNIERPNGVPVQQSSRDFRVPIEKLYNAVSQQLKQGQKEWRNCLPEPHDADLIESFTKGMNTIAPVRNLINHAGIGISNEDLNSVRKARKKIKSAAEELIGMFS